MLNQSWRFSNFFWNFWHWEIRNLLNTEFSTKALKKIMKKYFLGSKYKYKKKLFKIRRNFDKLKHRMNSSNNKRNLIFFKKKSTDKINIISYQLPSFFISRYLRFDFQCQKENLYENDLNHLFWSFSNVPNFGTIFEHQSKKNLLYFAIKKSFYLYINLSKF